MGGLTQRQVRIRAALMVIAFALTLALIVLAFAFAGTSDWILMVILSIDLPVYVLLGIAEWIARTRT